MSHSYLGFFAILLILLPACSEQVETESVHTPIELRYTTQKQEINLRPVGVLVSIPANELWAVHTNPVNRGSPQNNPYVGKAWDRVEARFVLLPEVHRRTPELESIFTERGGRRLLIIRLMQPMSADGDPRKTWKNLEKYLGSTISADSELVELIKDSGKRPPLQLIAKHPELGLVEYEYKVNVETRTRFYLGENVLIRCWYLSFRGFRHECGTSFNLSNGLLVNVMFSYENLPNWKRILKFAKQRSKSYIVR
ncbi:hypothetical protein [Neptuniibacter sp. QD34_54]|uniref:hypothetical protein n=1 Tax=Neptuniibacter sp. QD34_54 TaxID=3398208 RepID=UPI0039F4DE80